MENAISITDDFKQKTKDAGISMLCYMITAVPVFL